MLYNISMKGDKPMKKIKKKKVKSLIKEITRLLIAVAAFITAIAKLIEALN